MKDSIELLKKKHKANSMVAMAKVNGLLVPQPCSKCGNNYKVNAHHENYDEPLNIIWLCPSCHRLRHIELNGGKLWGKKSLC
jgi:hypothetical protein